MSKIVNQVTWMIGGPQGSGVDSAATLYARAVAGTGLWVFGNREYHSNIMGKHSYYRVRAGARPLHSHEDSVQLLATFEPSTLAIHLREVAAEAVTPILKRARLLVDIEMNYTGQLAALVREQTGIEVAHRVLKWTGRPISETEVVAALTEIAQKKSRKVVLSYGL